MWVIIIVALLVIAFVIGFMSMHHEAPEEGLCGATIGGCLGSAGCAYEFIIPILIIIAVIAFCCS